MSDTKTVGQLELGRYLTQVRERAGIKQAELARKITWSPVMLSRVETGERELASDELETILGAIGSADARNLSKVLSREWKFLPRPPLDHPDQDLLWTAEKVAQELVNLGSSEDVRHAFQRRLSEFTAEIERTANLLLKRDHQIAFIGSIGIGKSTAICRLTGLEVLGKDGTPAPVLEAGAGGITICEVHLRMGPGYGLIIEPRSDEEIRADVTDFVEHILKSEPALGAKENSEEGESQGISKEIERAIRNMSRLVIQREKRADGKTIRRDEARELGQKFGSIREMVVEVLARMELHRRDSRDTWYDTSSGKPPLVWLKETFEHVNNGRHPDFTLPKRIEVVVPNSLLGNIDVSTRIIDTKGIDRTAARADLEAHLDDPHTLAVLCSGFNNAPAAELRLLLERAKEAGVRSLDLNVALLALPRHDEALAAKDDATGIKVESVEEGYELKGEQVLMALEPLGLQRLAVGFFNAREDDPNNLNHFISARLGEVRQSFRARMHEITNNAKALLLNHEREQVQEILRQAAGMMRTWISQNRAVPKLNAQIQDSLIQQMAVAHSSTIRATVRREGEWPNLNYSHHLGYGARRLAASAIGPKVEKFSAITEVLLNNPEYVEAKDLIQQTERVLNTSYEELLRKVQLMGQTAFRDEFKLDQSFWLACEREWGQGSGYRDRVTRHNVTWFKAPERFELEKQLHTLIEREWSQILNRVSSLLETDN